MRQLTPNGQQSVNNIAQRYGLSNDAVMTMLQAVVNGNGTMAQFSHPELGGSGQWMQGGMTMVGDMFNNNLKALVDNLCNELANLLYTQPFEPQPLNQGGFASGNWWPDELGQPSSSGAQNNMKYAYFWNSHRLAVSVNGQVSLYDTLDHQIGGVSQQQSGDSSVTFTSQYGVVYLYQLPLISVDGLPPQQQSAPMQQQPAPQSNFYQPAPVADNNQQNTSPQAADIFATIEQLGQLRDKGILTEEEFSTKKAELLARL